MKKVVLVTFELNSPGLNYSKVVSRIREYGHLTQIGVYSFLILTEQTPVQVRDYIKVELSTDDKIYVSSLGNTAAWYGLGDTVSTWIRDNQKNN